MLQDSWPQNHTRQDLADNSRLLIFSADFAQHPRTNQNDGKNYEEMKDFGGT